MKTYKVMPLKTGFFIARLESHPAQGDFEINSREHWMVLTTVKEDTRGMLPGSRLQTVFLIFEREQSATPPTSASGFSYQRTCNSNPQPQTIAVRPFRRIVKADDLAGQTPRPPGSPAGDPATPHVGSHPPERGEEHGVQGEPVSMELLQAQHARRKRHVISKPHAASSATSS
jgi:hypothetical protein